MTEPEEVKQRQRRRTRQEVQRLVREFGTSGLARSEFCRIHGMTLRTLQRGLKRERTQSSDMQTDGKRLVRVKVIGGSDTTDRERPLGMAVVLAKGRRIELSRDFDPAQLRRVVETLEGF
jgi:hypothetical protein